jgi:hypothetical protein
MHKKWLVLVGIFLFLIPSVMAQTQITDCPDKCVNSIIYQKGTLDPKTKLCVYGIQTPCKYGCEDLAKSNMIPSCKQFPDIPPIPNSTDYSETIWNMVKNLWDKEHIKGSISIFGTEYVLGQNGTLFLKLLDSNELPINNGFCSISVYYPNKTMKFMDDSAMSFLENGLYYKDFFVPTTEGLYIADASCVYVDTVYRFNIPTESAGYDGAIGGGTSPQPLTFRDIDCTDFHTLGGGTYQNWTFNYTSLGLINLSQITSIDFNWVGQISAANGNIQVYNWNTSAWDSIGTTIASTGITLSCGNNVYLSRSLANNFTKYISNNTIKMRIYRAGTATILTDAVEVIFHNNGSVVASLRGSSEVHVNNFFNQTSNLTVNLNQSQFDTLLTAINSVNMTANQTLSYVVALNGSVFNLSIAELSHFQQIIALLNSINYTLNTTLEYKLDLINGTVMQINQSQTAYYLSLWGAIESVGATLNGTITQYLVVINDTTYNLSVNEYNHYLSVLQAISSVNSSVNSLNQSQFQNYLSLYNLLIEINQTGNTTLELVTSINQSLLSDYISLYNLLYSVNGNVLSLNASEYQHFQELFVILTDINYTTNSTLEYKLDLINYTTWQSWMILQNLTIGNLTVFANINWSEGVPFIWNASGQSQINFSLLSLSNEGIQLVVETLTCVDNSTLMHTLNVTNCVLGQCLDSVKNITETCVHGCSNNMCIPPPQFAYMYAIGFALVIIGVMYVGWRAWK